MAADRFDHFFVAPTDFDRTLDFYARVLGWQVLSRWGGDGPGRGAVLQNGQMQVAMAEPHADEWFVVGDPDGNLIAFTQAAAHAAPATPG